jgi:eukaryotic-like serine/threonine-protein kinase
MSILNPDSWPEVSPYLDQALAIPKEDRAAWLSALRSANPAVADHLQLLLDEHADLVQEGFLEQSLDPFSSQATLTGQKMGAYSLVSLAGAGGMGSVWLAERSDGRFDRRVAIKFLRFMVVGHGEEERFKREGRILGRLQHPHIAQLIDAGLSSSGQPYLILEYVDGQHVDSYCDEHKLDLEDRIRLFLDVLDAVSHAHANLIVHRDIKPSNVMVRNDGQVKLLDFGIAKLLQGEGEDAETTGATKEGAGAMTPLFAAPEQLSGGPITTRTDVYALGVLFYLLLTGYHPAGPGPHSAADIVKVIVDTEPPRPSHFVAQLGSDGHKGALSAGSRADSPEKLQHLLRGDLDTIVAKALKKDPQERYASASAFADDLRRYLAHEPIAARPDKLSYLASKFVRRHRVAVALGSIASVVTMAGLIGTVIQARTARAQRDFAFHQLARIQQHDEFLEFLLSDAAPSGKPFTVNDLLARAEHIVEKQRNKDEVGRTELMNWVGGDYSAQDQNASARPILERAYELSRKLSDRSARAEASCLLATSLARDEVLPRAESLIQEGLREVSNDPRFVLDRVNCLRQGSEVSRQRGESQQSLSRMQEAQRVLRGSPFDSEELEMGTSLDLASAYSEAGRDLESISEFERAAAIMSSLGRDETQTAVALYNNLGVELDQIGRPLDAEKVYRRVIDISRDGQTEEAVSPMVLNNYARILRQLDRLDQAADYAERAYTKAGKVGDQLVVNQSLLERSRIYLAQHNLSRAEAMVAEVEPRLRQSLPSGHYALAGLAGQKALFALEKRDIAGAERYAGEAIEMDEAAVRSGGAGAFYLPTLLVTRSTVDIAAGHPAQGEADANRALTELQAKAKPGTFSSRLGYAYLAQARALAAQGKRELARTAAGQAMEHLRNTIGPDHPDTRSARQQAQIAQPLDQPM